MKIIGIKIDGEERMEWSLGVKQRTPCRHRADLGSVYTIQIRVLSRKFGVPEWELFVMHKTTVEVPLGTAPRGSRAPKAGHGSSEAETMFFMGKPILNS